MATDPAPEGQRPDGLVETLARIINQRTLGVEVVGTRTRPDGDRTPMLVITLCVHVLGPPHVLYLDVMVVAIVGPPPEAAPAQDEDSSDSF